MTDDTRQPHGGPDLRGASITLESHNEQLRRANHATACALNERDVARAERNNEQAAREKAESDYARVAQAVGVAYEADGHDVVGGPVDEVVAAAEKNRDQAVIADEALAAKERAEAEHVKELDAHIATIKARDDFMREMFRLLTGGDPVVKDRTLEHLARLIRETKSDLNAECKASEHERHRAKTWGGDLNRIRSLVKPIDDCESTYSAVKRSLSTLKGMRELWNDLVDERDTMTREKNEACAKLVSVEAERDDLRKQLEQAEAEHERVGEHDIAARVEVPEEVVSKVRNAQVALSEAIGNGWKLRATIPGRETDHDVVIQRALTAVIDLSLRDGAKATHQDPGDTAATHKDTRRDSVGDDKPLIDWRICRSDISYSDTYHQAALRLAMDELVTAELRRRESERDDLRNDDPNQPTIREAYDTLCAIVDSLPEGEADELGQAVLTMFEALPDVWAERRRREAAQ